MQRVPLGELGLREPIPPWSQARAPGPLGTFPVPRKRRSPGFGHGNLGEVLSGIPVRLLRTRAWSFSEEPMGSQRPGEGGFPVLSTL